MNDLQSGTVADRYVVEAVLGAGAMATVYRVRHVDLGTLHAMKVMSLSSDGFHVRMLQEGRIQAGLRHPNVVAVTDVVRIGGAPALIMEFVEGPTLEQLLGRYVPSLSQADPLAQDILRGVAAAHAQGLVHRDLKPANVLLATLGDSVTAKVADFGIAKILAEGATSATQTGTTMGTPTFMAPEQFRNAKDVDARADVFSLGAILYELVTGAPAFSGIDLIACFQDASEGRYVPVRDRVPSAPARMVAAIEGALQGDRDKRFPDATALLRVWRGDDAGAALPDKPASQPWEGAHLEVLANLSPRARDAQGAAPVPVSTREWKPPGTIRPTPSKLSPPTRAPWIAAGAFAGVAGMVVAIVAVGAVGASVWWTMRGPPDAAVVDTPVMGEPIASAPISTPPPAVVAPVAPLVAVLEPVATPVATRASPPAATPVAPPAKATPTQPTSAATSPAPVEPDNVFVENAGHAWFLDAKDTRVLPGHLAPGDYRLFADFGDATAIQAATLHVEPGVTYTFRCSPGVRSCTQVKR